jgi:hypothetical protein
MTENSTLTLDVYVPIYFGPSVSRENMDKRIGFFAEQILHLSYLNLRRIRINAYTNNGSKIPEGIWDPLLAMPNESSFRIVECNKSELANEDGHYEPQLLTWVHKEDLKHDIGEGDSDSIYLYLEDDALFTQANLDYFLHYRPVLKKVGLIPSFLRAEWSSKLGLWIDSDAFERIQFQRFFEIGGVNGLLFYQPTNPYCALILLDQELALEYLDSNSFDRNRRKGREGLIWDTAASSALGLIYENFPNSYLHRIAVPVKSKNDLPITGSIVRHQGNRYANEIWWRHFRLFDGKLKPNIPVPRRSLLQKIIRFKVEYRNIIKKHIKNSKHE